MDVGFKIGIELELLLRPTRRSKNDFKNLEDFAQFIVAHCNAARLPAPRIHNDVDGIYEGPNTTTEWSLTDDATIKTDEDDQWPLELVSPILRYDTQSTWRDEVRLVFKAIRLVCEVTSNRSCGVHVHISPPGESRWSLDTLKSLCRSIFYFEGAIEALVPPQRRSNEYTANNRRDNSLLKGKSITTCLSLVNRCNHPAEIADLMNDGGARYFSWNFTNLYYGGVATVEFRQAPGAIDETMCIPWVEIVVTFVHGSKMTSSYRDLLHYSRDVEGLRRFLLRHEVSGFKRSLLDHIFRGKSGFVVPEAVRALREEERTALRAKMEEGRKKNLMMMKFGLKSK